MSGYNVKKRGTLPKIGEIEKKNSSSVELRKILYYKIVRVCYNIVLSLKTRPWWPDFVKRLSDSGQ